MNCDVIFCLKERIEQIEKRVADLEANQLQAVTEVTNYIKDTESLSNKMHEELKALPDTLIKILTDNGFGE